jgi:hypothetical protein
MDNAERIAAARIDPLRGPWTAMSLPPDGTTIRTGGGVVLGITAWPKFRSPAAANAMVVRIVSAVNWHDDLVREYTTIGLLNQLREAADARAVAGWIEAHPDADPNPTRPDVIGWLLDHWLATRKAPPPAE